MTAPEAKPKFDPFARRSWTDLGPRVASAVVLIAITLAGVYLGGYVFAVLVGGVFAGCYREWERMVTLQPVTRFGGGLIGLLFLSALLFPAFGFWISLLPVAIGATAAVVVDRSTAGWRVAGLAFFGLVIMVLLSIRGTGMDGFIACMFLVLVIWLTDTSAFFTGRQMGGEKLAPDISPGKTWSGAVGGLAVGTLGGLIFWLLWVPSPWWIGAILAASTSIIGQIGDLVESGVKRRFRVKDSGDIIPGHGGLMDRLDSLTFAAVFIFAVGYFNAGQGSIANGILSW